MQVCDKRCIMGNPEFAGQLEVSAEPAGALTPELQKRLTAKEPEIEVVVDPGQEAPPAKRQDGNGDKAAVPTVIPVVAADQAAAPPVEDWPTYLWGLLAFIQSGIVFGAISLVTPCVFPMIPITVSFFIKQSEKEHHKPFVMALVYSGTIVAMLTAGGVLLIGFFQNLSQHWVTNLALGLLFGFFALSLFGMYEIRLPSSLANFTSTQQGRGGLIGIMFMALTFTIISFTCVAPFYGTFIALTATSASSGLKIGLGAFAFSATFAFPFFFLALFPNLLRNLPKSGSWMNTIKVVMGFLELVAAFKFLRAGELFYFGEADLLTRDFVLGIWVTLFFLCGLYLLNLYRLPHDDPPAGHLGVPRLLFSMLFLSLSFYLLPGIFNQRPKGQIYAWVDAFLLQDIEAQGPAELANSGSRGNGSVATRLEWTPNLSDALKLANEQKKLVFIDFTGVTCTNCTINEKSVFPRQSIKDLFSQYVLVQLYTDRLPKALEGISQTSADQNKEIERKQFGTLQLPLYGIVRPLEDGTYKVVDSYKEGKINDVKAFEDFLRSNLAVNERETRTQAVSR
jgi:thiol:disulfide interchange protein DsbD